MVINRRNNAFSLAEVLVATIVMAMVMVGVVSFIQHGLSSWRRGQERLEAKNYSRLAFEFIKHELQNATVITTPSASNSSNKLEYSVSNVGSCKIVTKPSALLDLPANSDFKDDVLIQSISDKPSAHLARHVRLFMAERLGAHTVKIYLQINDASMGEPEINDESGEYIPYDILSSESMVIFAPQVKNNE